MTQQQLKELRNACHDYGKVTSGEFPTETALLKAKSEGRLVAKDTGENGYIKIVGENECHITFDIND